MTTDDLVWLISWLWYRGSTTRRGNEAREHESLAEEDGEPMDRADPNGEDEDETDQTGVCCHALTDTRCWSSAGTAGWLVLLRMRPVPRAACGLTLGPEMESGPRPRKGAGLTGNYSPAV